MSIDSVWYKYKRQYVDMKSSIINFFDSDIYLQVLIKLGIWYVYNDKLKRINITQVIVK